jgi:pyruvate dehydrogenase E2 component (dihydrolipoamide acetyltransferase)
MIEVKLPDLGEGIEEAEVVEILVSEGDELGEDQSILELETDKAVAEFPSPNAGRISTIHVKAGDTVKPGDTILTLDDEAPAAERKEKKEEAEQLEEAKKERPLKEEKPEEKAVEKKPAKTAAPRPEKEEKKAEPEPRRMVAAGPATRRLARELGVEIAQVRGSGPGGRITEQDVRSYVKDLAAGAAAPVAGQAGVPALPDFSQWGPIERQALRGVRRKTAQNVSLSWQQVPHVTQHDVADITEFEAARQRYKAAAKEGEARLTITALALKAVAVALKEFPRCNSSLDFDSGEIILKLYYHIGVAVDTEHGLLVPVIRDVDKKSILELAAELEDVSERTRKRKLDLSEMRGGTFTITNLGGIGGTAFTPIVNYPEVAILGMSRGRLEPVVRENGQLESRVMLPLSLSYDHRVIDGADGARFLRRVASLISDPLMLILKG